MFSSKYYMHDISITKVAAVVAAGGGLERATGERTN